MKLCYVTLGFAPAFEFGGPVKNSYELLRRIVRQDVSVTVCCTNLAGKSRKLFDGTRTRILEGIEVIYFDTYKLFPLGIGSFGVYYAPGMTAFCRKRLGEFDVIHMDGYRVLPNMIFSRHARDRGIPYVIQARGTLPADFNSIVAKRVFDVIFGRSILQNASLLIASSDIEKQQYLALLPGIADQIRIIGHGFDEEEYGSLPNGYEFRNRWIPEGESRFIVSYVGRIHVIKGLDFLIRACSRSIYRDRLLILIAGPDEGDGQRLREIASREGISDQVIFIGQIDGEEKRGMYAGSDVVIYASRSESFGLVAFEAVLCGTPIIVSRNTGCGELMNRYQGASLVDYGDVTGMALGLDEILDNPARSRERSLVARQRILAEMGWERITGQYREMYFEAVKKKRGANLRSE